MNKSLLTNLFCSALIASAFALPEPYHTPLLFAGLFGLSGALTNQLAIHMLFEKVPFLYGSGVIILRFEAFKSAIKSLMMEQFFTKEQLDAFFAKEEKKVDLSPLIENTDFSPTYDALCSSVMESSFGNMLGMFGGEAALQPLKEPFLKKLKTSLVDITSSEAFDAKLTQALAGSSLSEDVLSSVEGLIDQRLEEVTPLMVKEMIQRLIREHLGWLVLWGGFFGSLIGLVSAFIF